MKVLIACEESQVVCIAFRNKGHEAYSCDILPCSGGHPEWHIQDDVLKHLNDGWDMMIAHPPCTDLAVSGARWFEKKRLDGSQEKSIRFFFELWKKSNCCENPIGIINGGSYIKKWFLILFTEMTEEGFPFQPTQIIQPWQFGDPFQKTTCLWLKDLPPLLPTQIVSKGETYSWKDAKTGKIKTQPLWYAQAKGFGGKVKSRDFGNIRSKTFPGIAEAMATQWGTFKTEMI